MSTRHATTLQRAARARDARISGVIGCSGLLCISPRRQRQRVERGRTARYYIPMHRRLPVSTLAAALLTPLSILLIVLIMLASGSARSLRAQTNPAQTSAGPVSRAAILSRGWSAIADQKYAAADQAVEQLLARAP